MQFIPVKATNWSCNFRWAWLNAKVLSANQIVALLNFNISKTIAGIMLIFYMQLVSSCLYMNSSLDLGCQYHLWFYFWSCIARWAVFIFCNIKSYLMPLDFVLAFLELRITASLPSSQGIQLIPPDSFFMPTGKHFQRNCNLPIHAIFFMQTPNQLDECVIFHRNTSTFD